MPRIGREAANRGIYRYHQRERGKMPDFAPCDGCLSERETARQGCRIRACANGRRLPTCAHCEHLFCGLLEADMAVIDAARREFAGTMPAEDFKWFLEPFQIRAVLTRLGDALKASDAPAPDRTDIGHER
jgi:hypothetical protein